MKRDLGHMIKELYYSVFRETAVERVEWSQPAEAGMRLLLQRQGLNTKDRNVFRSLAHTNCQKVS
jgi:hypothetical protein